MEAEIVSCFDKFSDNMILEVIFNEINTSWLKLLKRKFLPSFFMSSSSAKSQQIETVSLLLITDTIDGVKIKVINTIITIWEINFIGANI